MSITFVSSWKPRVFSKDRAEEKMRKNARKAIEEHAVTPHLAKKLLEKISFETIQAPIRFSFSAFEKGKKNREIEDVHFFRLMETGLLVGICDGHGGREVADYTCEQFKEQFFDELEKTNYNVHQVFEKIFFRTANEVMQKADWDKQGVVAVVCFLEKKTGRVYTATLGDCEATIYRRIERELWPISISCMRNWSYPKEIDRAANAFKESNQESRAEAIKQQWALSKNPKWMRFPGPCGINVSRSIGDMRWMQAQRDACSLKIFSSTTSKPKITLNYVQPGDRLILASDGLRDLSEKLIVQEIERFRGNNLARHLCGFASKRRLAERLGEDDVTVLVITIQ